MILVELIENTLNLPSIVRIGHKHGDVIMVEYFDYNCPWCKRSAQALPDLLKAEPELTYKRRISQLTAIRRRNARGLSLSSALWTRALSAAASGPVRLTRHHRRSRALARPPSASEAIPRMTGPADSEKMTQW